MSPAPPTTPKAIVSAAAAEPAAPPWLRQVALLTGVLAALGAFLSVRSSSLSNDAIYRSTQATLAQDLATDKWGEYQADSIKRHIDETQLRIMAAGQPGREALEAEAADLKARQPAAKAEADGLVNDRKALLANGDKLLAEKDVLGYAGMAGQLAIALASVAALTRRKAAFFTAIVFGGVSFGVTGYAMVIHYFFMKA
jgi:hypothetical protein